MMVDAVTAAAAAVSTGLEWCYCGLSRAEAATAFTASTVLASHDSGVVPTAVAAAAVRRLPL